MKTTCTALIAIALGTLLGGCGGGSQDSSDGYVRFVHVSPGTDDLVITQDGNALLSSLQYHGATAYTGIGSGTPQIKVKSATSDATYVDAQIAVASNAHYSYILYGGGSAVTAVMLRDDTGDAASGKFKLRIVDLATGIGSLDVYLLTPGSTIAGSAPSYSGIASGSTGSFAEISTGDYNIVLTPAGSKETVYDSGKQSLSQNSKVSLLIFATGSGKLVNAALLLGNDSGTTNFVDNPFARFKFVSATTDLQTSDVLIDGSVALANVPYGSIASYGAVTAGSRNFRIQASDAPGAYVYDHSQTLNAAYDHSLVAYSIQGTGNAGMFALQDNNLPPSSGRAKLRIVNAGSDGTAYDAYINYSRLLSGIAPATGSGYQEVDGATYAVTFSPAGTTTQAATLTAEFDAGHVYTIYVYGRNGSAAAVLTRDY